MTSCLFSASTHLSVNSLQKKKTVRFNSTVTLSRFEQEPTYVLNPKELEALKKQIKDNKNEAKNDALEYVIVENDPDWVKLFYRYYLFPPR